jgi:hypothetical protein
MTWQLIQTAPTDGTAVDIWAKGERHTDMTFKNGGPGEDSDWDHEMYCLMGDRIIESLEEVTHWMPIPDAPAEAV